MIAEPILEFICLNFEICGPFLNLLMILENPNFKVVEFEHFKKEVGLVTFTLSVLEWVEKIDVVGFELRMII